MTENQELERVALETERKLADVLCFGVYQGGKVQEIILSALKQAIGREKSEFQRYNFEVIEKIGELERQLHEPKAALKQVQPRSQKWEVEPVPNFPGLAWLVDSQGGYYGSMNLEVAKSIVARLSPSAQNEAPQEQLRDAERLDWLEKQNGGQLNKYLAEPDDYWQVTGNKDDHAFKAPSLREAIDAAMQSAS
jgi:hypothetical protein